MAEHGSTVVLTTQNWQDNFTAEQTKLFDPGSIISYHPDESVAYQPFPITNKTIGK